MYNYLRRVFHCLKAICWLVFDSFVLSLVSIDSKRTPAILWVRMDASGDFIIWLGSVRAQGTKFQRPTYKWFLICDSANVELAQASGLFDEVLGVSRSRFSKEPVYRFEVLKRVRFLNVEVAVCPVLSRNVTVGDSLVRASSAPRRLGWRGNQANYEFGRFVFTDAWYTDLCGAESLEPRMHEIEINLAFAKWLGFGQCDVLIPDLRESFSGGQRSSLIEEEFFLLFPGSGDSRRNWPPERFAQLMDRVIEYSGLPCVLSGTSKEQAIVEEIFRLSKQQKRVIVHSKIEKWSETAGFLAQAKFVVANDTGTAHFAVALRVPLFCVLGGGTPCRFFPYPQTLGDKAQIAVAVKEMECFGCSWRCTQVQNPRTYPCILGVEVEDAWNVLKPLLESLKR